MVYVINQRHRLLVSRPGRQFAQFTVTDVTRDQHRQGDFLFAGFPVLPPCVMDQTVQRPPVLIQMGDHQRLRLCLRGPSGIVLHQRLVERRGLTCRQGFPLAQRLLYRLFLRRREFHHRTARRPGAFFSRHLLRRDLLNGGQGAVHIPLNQAVDRRSQLRHLAHNLFHDGNVGGAALLHQPERLARRDGLQLVVIPTGHRPSTAGDDEGVGFCHIGQPYH